MAVFNARLIFISKTEFIFDFYCWKRYLLFKYNVSKIRWESCADHRLKLRIVHGQSGEKLKATEDLMVQAGFGKIDVLVNNAGAGCKPRENGGKLLADSLENMDFLYQLNFRSAIEMTLLAMPYLEKTKATNYADKLGAQGIRINSLNPGAIKTSIVSRCDILNGQEKFEHFAAENTSLGRIGDVSEVSPILLFLASEQASYVTGATWLVDGGMLVKGSKAITLKDLENGK
uniref:Uncharacterized protein n=1 Tax=Ditylenchus dipsaci TaxID=166011 RepID=A0A915DQX6_9BILA